MENSGGGAAGAIISLIVLVIQLAVFVAVAAGAWKIFVKAGQPGWAAIVPFYNYYVLTQIVGRPILWFILCLVPCVQFVALILIAIDVAKSFGKSTGYGVGLALLAPIFIPMLGFSDAQYSGPSFKG